MTMPDLKRNGRRLLIILAIIVAAYPVAGLIYGVVNIATVAGPAMIESRSGLMMVWGLVLTTIVNVVWWPFTTVIYLGVPPASDGVHAYINLYPWIATAGALLGVGFVAVPRRRRNF